jgi:ABC-type spermidine/putrescine transport system permease subunit I
MSPGRHHVGSPCEVESIHRGLSRCGWDVKASPWLPWLYAFPMSVFITVVFTYPIATLFFDSMENVSSSAFLPSTYAGFSNFRQILSDSLFLSALSNNLKSFPCVPVMVALSVILSAILFDRQRGWKVYLAFLFISHVLPTPVVGIVFGNLFQFEGVFRSVLRSLQLGVLAGDWLGSPSGALHITVSVIIWNELGFGVVLCFARLMSVGGEYFESARIDRARWWALLSMRGVSAHNSSRPTVGRPPLLLLSRTIFPLRYGQAQASKYAMRHPMDLPSYAGRFGDNGQFVGHSWPLLWTLRDTRRYWFDTPVAVECCRLPDENGGNKRYGCGARTGGAIAVPDPDRIRRSPRRVRI